jgi:membrane protein
MHNPSRRSPGTYLLDSWRTVQQVARFAVQRAGEERIAQVAGSLTFTTVLSVVPLLTIFFAVLSALPIFEQMQDGLRHLLLQNLMPTSVSDSIFRYLNQFVAKSRGLTLIGLSFLAVTAVSTMLTIDRALNTIWRVRRARPLYQRVLVYWAVLTIGPVLLGVSLSLSSYVASASAGFVNQPSPPVALLIAVVPLVALTLAYAGLYFYVPNRPVAWRDAFIGGLAGAIAFEVAKRGFAIYIARFPTYAAIYGALAALPIFLLWVYVSWFITLAGAAIAASLPTLHDRRWNWASAPGQDFADALRVIRALNGARKRPLPGLTARELGGLARLDVDSAEAILIKLETHAIVIRVRSQSVAAKSRSLEQDLWMFTADATRISVGKLFSLFAFDGPTSAEIGFARDDPLRQIVTDTPHATLELSLAEIL